MTIVRQEGEEYWIDTHDTGVIALPAAIGVTIHTQALSKVGTFLGIAVINNVNDQEEDAPIQYRIFGRLEGSGIALAVGNVIDSVELRIANLSATATNVQYTITMFMGRMKKR